MEIKAGVTLAGLHLLMRPVLRAAERIWKAHGRDEGVTVTEACGGTHSATSWHYYGLALDLRTRYFSTEELDKVEKEMKRALPEYDIIVHSSHMHVEIGNTLAEQHGLLT